MTAVAKPANASTARANISKEAFVALVVGASAEPGIVCAEETGRAMHSATASRQMMAIAANNLLFTDKTSDG